MANSQPKEKAARLREAITQLGEAVNSLPIKDLTAPIKEEQGIRREQAHQTHARYLQIRESIDDLATCAALAHPEAIRELHYLGRFIQDRLNDISAPPQFKAGQDSPDSNESGPSEEDSPSDQPASGCDDLNIAADRLRDILEKGDDQLMEKVGNLIKNLPKANFSFPLESLLELDGPPTGGTKLTSEFCDRLIQDRLNNECSRILCDLETKAELPSDLPAGWDARSRKEEGPINLVRPIFVTLDKQRRRFRSAAERAELEAEAEQWLSPRDFIAKIEETWKAHQYEHSSIRSEMVVDDLPWMIMRHKVWTDRAAILPPLSSDTAVISKWADAGLFWLIAKYDDDHLEDVEWGDSINSRIRKSGSVLGGLRSILVEGLETLAGKDRKGEYP